MAQGRRRRARAAPLSLEREHWARGEWVAGVDEVGVGPLAGPVVAAAVVLEPDRGVRGARDSKALTPELREELFLEIQQTAVAVGVGAASTREIERYNIYRATHLAMRRALARLSMTPAHVLVDGRPVPDLGWTQTAVVKGDAKCQSIACASIVAKVVRDRLMRRLAPRYPGYGWEHNAGYSTAEHMAALRTLGPTPHHRNTFTPVAQLDLELGR
jgi:ribonuclease HII